MRDIKLMLGCSIISMLVVFLISYPMATYTENQRKELVQEYNELGNNSETVDKIEEFNRGIDKRKNTFRKYFVCERGLNIKPIELEER